MAEGQAARAAENADATLERRVSYAIEPIWQGQTVVIMASGPSLTLEQVRRVAIAKLKDRCRVIAVNDAIFIAWWADWLHAYDSRWWF